MKKLSFFLITCCILLVTCYTQVFAHELKTDGSIGAVLHIDPDDEPIAGQQSAFFFEFKDTQNKFQPTSCACTFTITEDGTQLYTQPIFQNNTNPNLNNASVFYTFPKEDVYEVIVTGKPTTPNAFQPFTLTYPIRVDRTVNNDQTQQNPNLFITHGIHFFAIGGVIVVFIILAIINTVKKRRKQ